jgi:hypothetical protein
MRIDNTHRRWAAASAAILVLATLSWIACALWYPGGVRGGSVPGLVYGVLAYATMLFAGLLGARKRVPLWRIGRAQAWMRGHLWLGALSLPMALFHAAFAARGPLTILLMTLLTVTVLSGIAGAALQHAVPVRMLDSVPLETIYEQIPHVREQLLPEATRIIVKPHMPAEAETVLPFLRRFDPASPLAQGRTAGLFFAGLQKRLPPAAHEDIADLAGICDEHRQLEKQRKHHLILHGWLLVHVPLSVTLPVLGAVHAIAAIRY